MAKINEKSNTMLHFLKMDLLYHAINSTVEAEATRYAFAKAIYSENDKSKV